MSSSLKELGILFGPEPKMQEYGLAFYAANCTNNEFLSAANTKQNPAQLKNCGVYQLMRTANYKDASSYTDQNAVHPLFVQFIELLGLWHSTIDPQGVAAFTYVKDSINKKLEDGLKVDKLNKEIREARVSTNKGNTANDIINLLKDFFGTTFKKTDQFITDLSGVKNIANTDEIKQIVFRQLASEQAGKKKTAYEALFEIATDANTSDAELQKNLKTLKLAATQLLAAYKSDNVDVRDVVNSTIKILKADGTEVERAKRVELLNEFVEKYDDLIKVTNPFEIDGTTKKYTNTAEIPAAITAAKAFRINLNKIYNNDSGDSITYFENIIPYLPKDIKVNGKVDKNTSTQKSVEYLRELYHNAYKNGKLLDGTETKDIDTKATAITFDQINISKYLTNATESAFRDVSDKLSGTFKNDDIEFLVDLAAQKPGDLLYTLKNGKLVKNDGSSVAEVTDADLEKGLADKAKLAEYMSRCILSADSKGLETCLEYINEPTFFKDITPQEVHPTLAKEVLKKFKFGRHSRTNQPESYENWKHRMESDTKTQQIVQAIEKNKPLVEYLKAMLKLVSDNLAIIGVPQKSTSVSVSNDPVVRNLEAKIPMYKNVSVGLNGTGEIASAEMMARGNAYFNAGFSTAPYANAQIKLMGGRRRRIQKGGAVTSNLTASTLENYFSTQISSLLRKNNVTLSTSDQETINGLLANLKKQELKVEKLINIIGVLNEIYSFAEKTGNLEKSMDIGAIIRADSRVIDYITTRKDEAQKCLISTTNNTQNITDELCNLTRDLTNQVFKPIHNGSVNGDIILF